MKRFVISGGPCSGKTTTVSELGKEFKVFQEAARKVLSEKFNGKHSKDVGRDSLQREIFKLQEQHFNENKSLDNYVFFDRGFGDTLSYYLFDNLDIPSEFLEKAKEMKYDKIFFLEPLPFYKKDKLRQESKKEQEKISDYIVQIYSDLGYEIIKVPAMSVKERVNFIKEFLF